MLRIKFAIYRNWMDIMEKALVCSYKGIVSVLQKRPCKIYIFFFENPVRYIVPIYCTISLDVVPFSLCYTVGYLYLSVFLYIIIHMSICSP